MWYNIKCRKGWGENMLYSANIKRAMLFACNIHKNDYDKAGYPYIHHVMHVAEQMHTEDETIVALLHDVLEDHRDSQTLRLVNQLGFNDRVYEALHAITRSQTEQYMTYIKRVSRNKIATAVKIADLEHNMQRSRLGNSFDSTSLMERYHRAYDYLVGDISYGY